MLTILMLAAAAAPVAASGEFSDAELKHYFFVCDESSRQNMLDDGDAATCSLIFEQLKAQVFKGDTGALFEWWRAEKDRREKAGPSGKAN